MNGATSCAPRRLVADETAATMVEYALMLALIALIALSAVAALGKRVGTAYDPVAAAIKGAPKGCTVGNGVADVKNPNC